MKKFMDEDFLLQTETAKRLYHEHAEKMPIFDYHCHIPPRDIAENTRFENITKIWLFGDHYKWRAMRANGVDERFCTGDASDREKFEKWAETVPHTVRNPLYHWTHLELKRFFGIEKLLSPATCSEIWDECNEKLQSPEYSVRNLIIKSHVHTICTTDDPVDSLEYHRKIKNDGFEVNVLPAWRPDKAMSVDNKESFIQYVDKLAIASGIRIETFESFMEALQSRHNYFHDNGCRLSDHGIETAMAEDYTLEEICSLFIRIRKGIDLSSAEILRFKSCMLYEFGVMDHSRGWVQQFHLGALRNNNTRLFKTLGPDTGFDSIGDFEIAKPLSKFLDRLDMNDQLAKTVIYNLNPRDNELNAIWFCMVVPGSERWNGKADKCSFQSRPVKPFCGYAHRFKELSFICPA